MSTFRPPRRPVRRLRPAPAFAGAALVLALAVPAGPAAGQTGERIMCSQPVRPTCVDSDLTYESQRRIDRCRRDVESYAEAVQNYLDCLERQAEAQKKTLDEVRHQFRCHANDDVEC